VNVTARDIIKQLDKRHKNDLHYTEVKTGSSYMDKNLRIIDYLAIKKSWSPINITAYEIKVSRNDFERDDKWMAYLNYSHMFSFAAPKGIITLDELPGYVGLVEYNPDRGTVRTVRKAQYREIELPSMLLLYLLFWRKEKVQYKRNSTKEDWQRWIDGKIANRSLGYTVKSKLLKKNNELEDKMKWYKYAIEDMEEIKKLFLEHGLVATPWSIKNTIGDMLKSKGNVTPEMQRAIEAIESNAQKILKMIV